MPNELGIGGITYATQHLVGEETYLFGHICCRLWSVFWDVKCVLIQNSA